MIDAAGESSEAITMPPRAPPGNFGGDIEQPSRPVMLQRHTDFVPAHTDAQWVCGSPCLAVHGDRSSHAIHAAIPMRSPLDSRILTLTLSFGVCALADPEDPMSD
ncbi:hypothetical protein AURDEDRAFT_169300 [Auricularia subglabra TFB-10046 SS5]|nr:hypothetical protein AURDEDRAFT_169300 [Auricularia subglabra TFB-10046 SS5]